MKPFGTFLLMLLAAAVAAVVTYLVLSNRHLRERLAQQETTVQATAPTVTQRLSLPSTNPAPAPWRPTKLAPSQPAATAEPTSAVAATTTSEPGAVTLHATASGPRSGPALLVAGPPVVLGGGNWIRYDALPGSKVRIEGTSSLHAWEVNGSIIGGSLELQNGFLEAGLLKATVRIPIRTLKSYQKKMDEVMQETMAMAQFPNLDYQLLELHPKPAAETGKFEFDAVGALTLHGTTLTNSMPVTIEQLEKSTQLKVTGQTPLKMTDFGIQPVDVNLGIGHITTGDDVTVTFEWRVGRKE